MKFTASLKALSPTSLKTFESNIDTFVCRYVLGLPREPQTRAMSIGSAFDARIKGYLAEVLLGQKEWTAKLLVDQVEECNREWAFAESEKVFADYVKARCHDYLLQEIGDSIALRFEFEQFKTLIYEDGYEVPLYGKPDAYFLRRDGLHVVIDWKVNGYCSQASPAPGYIRLLDSDGIDSGPYKMTYPQYYRDILCVEGEIPLLWRDQLRMYTWMLGESGDWIAGVDQLVYRGGIPRYAQHRIRMTDDPDLRARIRFAWEHIEKGHYYHDRSLAESNMRVEMLQDNRALRNCLTFKR